jgi:hypothetical protein
MGWISFEKRYVYIYEWNCESEVAQEKGCRQFFAQLYKAGSDLGSKNRAPTPRLISTKRLPVSKAGIEQTSPDFPADGHSPSASGSFKAPQNFTVPRGAERYDPSKRAGTFATL